MNFKGIIFDLDGVICSTDEFHYRAWKELCNMYGLHFDWVMNNKLRGVSRKDSLEIILKLNNASFSEKEKEVMLEKKNSIYVNALCNLNASNLSDGVIMTLDELKKTSRLAIGSSSKNTKFILSKLGIARFFDAVSDGTMIKKSKPDPEVFLLAAALLDLEPKDCLVVEDSVSGIDAAVAGGFPCAGIGDAYSYEKCTYAIKTIPEILTIGL